MLNGAVSFEFSSTFVSALNLVASTPIAIDPAHGMVLTQNVGGPSGKPRILQASVSAPISQVQVEFDDPVRIGQQVGTILGVTSQGGFSLTTQKNGATSGEGHLSVTNLRVDLPSKKIFADLDGGNGVGQQVGVHLWSFSTQSAPFQITLNGVLTPGYGYPAYSISGAPVDLLGLYSPSSALDLMTRALNLNDIGKSGFSAVNDPGRIHGFGNRTLAVPEPSTYALTLAGVLALCGLSRHRRNTLQVA